MEERFISAHGFSPWLVGSIISGPVVKQNILAEGHSEAEILTSWYLRNRKKQWDLKQDTAPKDRLPVTYFLQLGSTPKGFHHLSVVPSNYSSISGLIH
jgi:hypothetical protein